MGATAGGGARLQASDASRGQAGHPAVLEAAAAALLQAADRVIVQRIGGHDRTQEVEEEVDGHVKKSA